MRKSSKSWNLLHQRGFTLPELVVVVVIGSVLMISTASMLISHMQSSAKMEALMRLQEAWSRVQYLLDQEIKEGRISTTLPTKTSCNNSISLTVPNPMGSDGQITYSHSADGVLKRSGPGVNANGTLDFANLKNETVMRGVTSFCSTNSDGMVSYTMELQDARGMIYKNSSEPAGARSRSRIIN